MNSDGNYFLANQFLFLHLPCFLRPVCCFRYSIIILQDYLSNKLHISVNKIKTIRIGRVWRQLSIRGVNAHIQNLQGNNESKKPTSPILEITYHKKKAILDQILL